MAGMNRAQEGTIGRGVAPRRSRCARALAYVGDPWGYILMLPAILFYSAFQIWPLIRGLTMAFSPYSWVIPETKGLLVFNGLENYRILFRDQEWRHSMWVSAKLTAGAWPLNFFLALFSAVIISKVTNAKWSAFCRIVSYLPVVLPMATAMLLWTNLYHTQDGYINHFLRTYLRIKNPPNWMGDPDWALFAVVLPTVWKGFGYDTLLFLIGIYSINRELYEAAEIDGANEWQQFWKVTLPLLKPIVVLVLVLSAGLMSATAQVMTLWGGGTAGVSVGGGPFQSALTAGLWSWATAFVRPDMRMGLAASSSLVLGLVSMGLSALVFKTVRVERV
jgi:ABC-type sugar transport system permease subunit